MTTFIEVNSPEAHSECFDAVKRVSHLLSKVESAEEGIKNALYFVGNESYRETIPTLVEHIESKIKKCVLAVEVAARVHADKTEMSHELSPEAMEYLRNSPRAHSIHSMNQVILDENNSIRDDSLDEDKINETKKSVEEINELVNGAQDIYDSIIGLIDPCEERDYYDDDDEWDDWDDEWDDWDDEDYDDDDEDDEDNDSGWWHDPMSFDDPVEEDDQESDKETENQENRSQPFIW